MNNTYTFIRHGETQWNKDGRYMGQQDIPLNIQGVIQAYYLRDNEDLKRSDIAYFSPLIRTRDTALIALAKRDVLVSAEKYILQSPHKDWPNLTSMPLISDSRIMERSHGVLETYLHSEIAEHFPQYKGKEIAVTRSFTEKPEGGESYTDLEVRVLDFLRDTDSKHSNRRIAVFTHNGPMRVLKGFYGGLSHEDTIAINNKNCEVVTFTSKDYKSL